MSNGADILVEQVRWAMSNLFGARGMACHPGMGEIDPLNAALLRSMCAKMRVDLEALEIGVQGKTCLVDAEAAAFSRLLESLYGFAGSFNMSSPQIMTHARVFGLLPGVLADEPDLERDLNAVETLCAKYARLVFPNGLALMVAAPELAAEIPTLFYVKRYAVGTDPWRENFMRPLRERKMAVPVVLYADVESARLTRSVSPADGTVISLTAESLVVKFTAPPVEGGQAS